MCSMLYALCSISHSRYMSSVRADSALDMLWLSVTLAPRLGRAEEEEAVNEEEEEEEEDERVSEYILVRPLA